MTEFSPDKSIFVSNIEEALVPGGHVEEGFARKIVEISPRALWDPDYDTVVLPGSVDPSFVDYVASLGREPQIVIPRGIDEKRLSLRDGFSDPELQRVVRNSPVSSYMGDRASRQRICRCGKKI